MEMNHKASSGVVDPVCGMTVNPGTALHSVVHDGKTFHFCCQGCADKFKATPAKYLDQPPKLPSGLITLEMPTTVSPGLKPSLPAVAYVCPMCPEVRESKLVPCPKCGMALEPENPAMARLEYTCPMHPEVARPEPGSCPICGMALEPRMVSARAEENPELADMSLRFWVALTLTTPLLAAAMADMVPGMPVQHALPGGWLSWVELVLATPAVLWAGWPFFQRGWASIVNRSTNMFTLIAMGTGVAYGFSLVATLAPGIFPVAFRQMSGAPPIYFEAAAAIVTLVLLGQVL